MVRKTDFQNPALAVQSLHFDPDKAAGFRRHLGAFCRRILAEEASMAKALEKIAEMGNALLEGCDFAMPAICGQTGKGCAYCCRQTVSISMAEAWRVLSAAIALPAPLQAQILARMVENDNGLPFRCPFLDGEEKCVIYEARPLPCRVYLSFSLASCAARGTGGGVLPPIYKILVEIFWSVQQQSLAWSKGLKPKKDLTISSVACFLREYHPEEDFFRSLCLNRQDSSQ